MAVSHLAEVPRHSPLWAHAEAIWFADYLCSGVPHGAPDSERSIESVVQGAISPFSDDLVMTLAKVGVLQRAPITFGSRVDLLHVRSAVVDAVRPYVVGNPEQWGPRFSNLVLSNAAIEDDRIWGSVGSGAVMTVGGLVADGASDEQIITLTAATHHSAEAVSCALALSAGIRTLAAGAPPEELVAQMVLGAARGLNWLQKLDTLISFQSSPPRSVDQALHLAVSDKAPEALIDSPSDFISARYVLACGVRAFFEGVQDDNPVGRAIQSAARTGDPDTAAVVAMALLQARNPKQVKVEINHMVAQLDLPTFTHVFESRPLDAGLSSEGLL